MWHLWIQDQWFFPSRELVMSSQLSISHRIIRRTEILHNDRYSNDFKRFLTWQCLLTFSSECLVGVVCPYIDHTKNKNRVIFFILASYERISCLSPFWHIGFWLYFETHSLTTVCPISLSLLLLSQARTLKHPLTSTHPPTSTHTHSHTLKHFH